MGLYARITPEDLGFEREIISDSLGQSVPVEYEEAMEVAAEVFITEAKKLVPIDTGYLCSTIDAGIEDDAAYFEATAEYAQYVEYGTWCQEAQPYFAPALEIAVGEYIQQCQEAYDAAQEILEGMMQDALQASMAAVSGDPGATIESVSFGQFLGGMGLFSIGAFLMFPILVNIYGIMDTVFNSGRDGKDSKTHNDIMKQTIENFIEIT